MRRKDDDWVKRWTMFEVEKRSEDDLEDWKVCSVQGRPWTRINRELYGAIR